LSELKTDLPVAEFLKTHFTDRQYAELRDAVKRMVEGYDAADPDRASTFALRDEWIGHGLRQQGRIAGGYGALIKFLVSECCGQGATIHLFSVVTAIEETRGRIAAYCDDGTIYEADAAILTVPLPRRSQPVPISDSVMSSKFCCASQRSGGPIVVGAILATCHSCSPAQRFPSGGHSIRPNIQC
jgi:protoporphyrinogen oxidase